MNVFVTLILLCVCPAFGDVNVYISTHGTFLIGENVMLVCMFEPETTMDTYDNLKWWKGSNRIATHSCPERSLSSKCVVTIPNHVKFALDGDGISSGNLTIRNVDKNDTGIYNCSVTTSIGIGMSSSQLAVTYPVSDQQPTLELLGTGDLREGKTQNITCVATGFREIPLFRWYLGNANVTSNSIETIEFIAAGLYNGISILRLKPTREQDEQILNCSIYLFSSSNYTSSVNVSEILHVKVPEVPLYEYNQKYVLTGSVVAASFLLFVSFLMTALICRRKRSNRRLQCEDSKSDNNIMTNSGSAASLCLYWAAQGKGSQNMEVESKPNVLKSSINDSEDVPRYGKVSRCVPRGSHEYIADADGSLGLKTRLDRSNGGKCHQTDDEGYLVPNVVVNIAENANEIMG